MASQQSEEYRKSRVALSDVLVMNTAAERTQPKQDTIRTDGPVILSDTLQDVGMN